MLRNLLTEDDLLGYAVKLNDLLYTGETDYSLQKEKATQFVMNEFISRRYDLKELMPGLVLRDPGTSVAVTTTGTGVEDTINRMRLVIDSITCTLSGKTLTLQGSADDVTYHDVTTIDILTTDTLKSVSFTDTYKYYRINVTVTSGVIDFRAYLAETFFEQLFAYKWLVFIFSDIRKAEGDQYDLKMKYYQDMYTDALNNAFIYLDSDDDGIPDSSGNPNIINILK